MEPCLFNKSDSQYDIDDIILSEYGTTVVGLEMMRSVNEENAEKPESTDCLKSIKQSAPYLFSELGKPLLISLRNWMENEGILGGQLRSLTV